VQVWSSDLQEKAEIAMNAKEMMAEFLKVSFI
jgi:hypothetical protein